MTKYRCKLDVVWNGWGRSANNWGGAPAVYDSMLSFTANVAVAVYM